MMRSHIKLGKWFGVPVRLDYSWLLIFALVIYNLGSGYFPQTFPLWPAWLLWTMAVLTSLMFFGAVLLHEVAHAVVARRIGVPVHDITLYLFGGAAQIGDEPKSAGGELLMAAAGPGTSLLLAALFGLLHLLTRTASQPLSALGLLLAGMNLSLAVFNMIPGFPLDGGRVLRALLWAWKGDMALATRWATRIGQSVAYGMIFFGAMLAFGGNLQSGLWLAFIGLFLESAARNSYAQLSLRRVLDGHVASELMTRECTYLPPQLTLDVLVEQYLMVGGQRCYVVGGPGQAQGLFTLHNVRRVPEKDWRTTRVGQITTPMEELISVREDTPLWDVLQLMTAEGVNQVPVSDEDGKMLGIVSRDQLITFLRDRPELGI